MNLEGELFIVKTQTTEVYMWCKVWTDERRVFEAVDGESGCLDLDWMEYLDQTALGRIREATPQEHNQFYVDSMTAIYG